MRKKTTIITLILAILGLFIFSSTSGYALNEESLANRPQYVEGEVLVKLKPDVSLTAVNSINSEFGTQTLREFKFTRTFHLQLPASLSVDKAISLLQRSPYVEYAVPNGIYYLDQTFPNDPNLGSLWGLNNTGQTGGTPDADIDAPEAWDITTGDHNVVIAVIDSGLDMAHPDIAANVWTNPGEIAGNGIDDDNNGYIDDVHGWDFSGGDNDPSPAGGGCLGHGTHTAGTIGAVGNNGVGISGVNWTVQIMPLKAFKPILGILCSANDANLIAAIEYHTMMGVRISSNSWGGTTYSAATYDAIRASNSVFVAASGNDGVNNDTSPHYPSSYDLDNIISVAAIDHNDALASFSNYGVVSVDVAAPGVDVVSTLPNNSYGSFSGTSMATPHVAGVVGLLLAQDPNLTINEVKWRILAGADNTGLPILTHGRANSYNALAWGLTPMPVTVDTAAAGSTDVQPGGTINVNFTVTNSDSVSRNVSAAIYARLQDGRELALGSATITLTPGQVYNYTLSKQVPASATPGATFRVFGQVQTSVSFDEDWVEYTVIP